MLIYLDLLLILNLWIDFLLLVATNIILKYKVSYIRILIASIVGSLSTFVIFINNNFLLFCLKIFISIIMQLIANRFQGIKTLLENVFYFYLVSIILAGTIYLFRDANIGFKENFFLLILFTPLVLYINKRQIKKLNSYYKEKYTVELYYKNKRYIFNAYLDTGNMLYDPYKKRPISIIYSSKIKFDYESGLLVPMETANDKSLLKCIKVEKMIVDNKIINNVLIGLSEKPFEIQDINMILHKDIIGGFRWFYFF